MMSPTILWLFFCLAASNVCGEVGTTAGTNSLNADSLENNASNDALDNTRSELEQLSSLAGDSGQLSGSDVGNLGLTSNVNNNLYGASESTNRLTRLSGQGYSDVGDTNNYENLRSNLNPVTGVYDFTNHVDNWRNLNSQSHGNNELGGLEGLNHPVSNNKLNALTRSGYYNLGKPNALDNSLAVLGGLNRHGIGGYGGLSGVNIIERNGLSNSNGLNNLENVNGHRSSALRGLKGNNLSGVNSLSGLNSPVALNEGNSVSDVFSLSRSGVNGAYSAYGSDDLNNLGSVSQNKLRLVNGLSGNGDNLVNSRHRSASENGVNSLLNNLELSNSENGLKYGNENDLLNSLDSSKNNVVNILDDLHSGNLNLLNELSKSDLSSYNTLNHQKGQQRYGDLTGAKRNQLQKVSLNRLKEANKRGQKPVHLDKLRLVGRSGSELNEEELLNAADKHNDGELNALSALASLNNLNNNNNLRSVSNNLNDLSSLSSSSNSNLGQNGLVSESNNIDNYLSGSERNEYSNYNSLSGLEDPEESNGATSSYNNNLNRMQTINPNLLTSSPSYESNNIDNYLSGSERKEYSNYNSLSGLEDPDQLNGAGSSYKHLNRMLTNSPNLLINSPSYDNSDSYTNSESKLNALYSPEYSNRDRESRLQEANTLESKPKIQSRLPETEMEWDELQNIRSGYLGNYGLRNLGLGLDRSRSLYGPGLYSPYSTLNQLRKPLSPYQLYRPYELNRPYNVNYSPYNLLGRSGLNEDTNLSNVVELTSGLENVNDYLNENELSGSNKLVDLNDYNIDSLLRIFEKSESNGLSPGIREQEFKSIHDLNNSKNNLDEGDVNALNELNNLNNNNLNNRRVYALLMRRSNSNLGTGAKDLSNVLNTENLNANTLHAEAPNNYKYVDSLPVYSNYLGRDKTSPLYGKLNVNELSLEEARSLISNALEQSLRQRL